MAQQVRRRSFRQRLRRWFLLLGSLYLGILLLVWCFENSLVYPRSTVDDHWENPPDPSVEEASVPSKDGNSIHGWFLAAPRSDRVVLFCHGNGGNISYMGGLLCKLHQNLGCSTMLFDYPGYGKSTGKPSEEGCYDSAEAALDWLIAVKGFRPKAIVVFGDSLGGAVAVETARRRRIGALVLTKTFTSLPAVGKRRFWFLPVNWLMRNRFESLAKMPEINVPVFIASGTNDRLVPFEMGKELFHAAAEPKEFFAMEGVYHDGPLSDDFMAALRSFLDGHVAAKRS